MDVAAGITYSAARGHGARRPAGWSGPYHSGSGARSRHRCGTGFVASGFAYDQAGAAHKGELVGRLLPPSVTSGGSAPRRWT